MILEDFSKSAESRVVAMIIKKEFNSYDFNTFKKKERTAETRNFILELRRFR